MSGETCASGGPPRLSTIAEALLAAERDLLRLDALDHGRRRRLDAQPREQRLDRVRPALGLDQRAARVVAHEPAQPQLHGQPVDVRAEADALHDALHAHAYALVHSRGRDVHLVQDEAVEQVVGDEHGALAALRPVALGQPERGRHDRVEAEPDEQPVERPGPPALPQAVGEQAVHDPERAAHAPVHELDEPPRPAALLLLAHEPRRRVLADQARVDGEHAHGGHGHGADDAAQLGVDDLVHAISSQRTW